MKFDEVGNEAFESSKRRPRAMFENARSVFKGIWNEIEYLHGQGVRSARLHSGLLGWHLEGFMAAIAAVRCVGD